WRTRQQARRRRHARAGAAARGRDLHGLRHRRLSRLCRPSGAGRGRPRLQGGSRLSRRGDRVVDAAASSPLRDQCMTIDLSVAVGGLKLRGPVLAASGTFGYGTEVPLLERRALGAMVSKGIFLRPRAGTPPPRIVETPSGMLNAIGLQGP